MNRSRCLRSLLVVLTMATPFTAAAQVAVDLPSLSVKARTEQRVGVTDFAIDYSSPAVKGRKIWGDLVPYDKVWRAGANAATKLVASKDFKFGGVAVKAGTYSLFMVPGKTSWSVHLNSDLAAGQNNHDAKKDVAKITVKPVAIAPRERLLFFFNDTKDDSTWLEMEWERVRIRVALTVDTNAHVAATIDKIDGEAWRPHMAAANYLFEKGDTNRALALVDKSIAIQSTWRNEWLRARILQKQGKKAEARAAAVKAQQLGGTDQVYKDFFEKDITKAVTTWK